MALIQHIFGIPSLRRTAEEVRMNISQLQFQAQIYIRNGRKKFYWILDEINNAGYLSPETVFVDGTHIKANANIKKMVKCALCPSIEYCTESSKHEKFVTKHIWEEYVERSEDIRHTPKYKALYEKRKETIERVFADAKEKHAMRYTNHRGLSRVTNWVSLKFAAMNLKKFAIHK